MEELRLIELVHNKSMTFSFVGEDLYSTYMFSCLNKGQLCPSCDSTCDTFDLPLLLRALPIAICFIFWITKSWVPP